MLGSLCFDVVLLTVLKSDFSVVLEIVVVRVVEITTVVVVVVVVEVVDVVRVVVVVSSSPKTFFFCLVSPTHTYTYGLTYTYDMLAQSELIALVAIYGDSKLIIDLLVKI